MVQCVCDGRRFLFPDNSAPGSAPAVTTTLYHAGALLGANCQANVRLLTFTCPILRVEDTMTNIIRGILLTLALAIIVAFVFDIHAELFEDGSFILRGCLPWAICTL